MTDGAKFISSGTVVNEYRFAASRALKAVGIERNHLRTGWPCEIFVSTLIYEDLLAGPPLGTITTVGF